MPLILFILGVISIVAGVAAIGTRFVDETGFDFSFAFGYQAIVGGILLIAFGRLLKHVADTEANTTRMAQAMALGSGSPSAAPMADLAVSEPVMVAPIVEPPAPEVDDRATHSHSAPAEPEAAVREPALAVDEADSSAPVEKIDVRGYMVDVFANGAVDVHTAEGAMRFESLAAFERELDRAAG